MTLFNSRSAAEISLVRAVETSNSNFALASRRCSFKSSSFCSTSFTSGAFNHGSRMARSCSMTSWRLRFFSAARPSSKRFWARFFSSSSRPLFRSSSPSNSAFLLASSFSFSCCFRSSASASASLLSLSTMAEPCLHALAVLSQDFFAWAFTMSVAFLISASFKPNAFERSLNSLVRSTAANSGCHAWAKSTGVWESAMSAASKQKSMTTGFPTSSVLVLPRSLTTSLAPLFTATRMPTFALVEHTSSCCFFPALTTKSRVSPKPFEARSETFCKASHVFFRPLSPLQSLPSLVRLRSVKGFSAVFASSNKAFIAPPFSSSCATRAFSPSLTGSATKVFTYRRTPSLDADLPLSSRCRDSFSEATESAICLSSCSMLWSRSSSMEKSSLAQAMLGNNCGSMLPVLP
mmetsp:Transcript_53749/g.149506  ORF Transcript_53749/g.149506 Transcript_53749/m.149506 type:complete len:406 (-) Transcript_53749:690-1907(-)